MLSEISLETQQPSTRHWTGKSSTGDETEAMSDRVVQVIIKSVIAVYQLTLTDMFLH
jgi:hypothetical protein